MGGFFSYFLCYLVLFVYFMCTLVRFSGAFHFLKQVFYFREKKGLFISWRGKIKEGIQIIPFGSTRKVHWKTEYNGYFLEISKIPNSSLI